MTGNQISYQRFLEDQRHNLVTEANQIRQISELERHNVVSESQGWKSLLETERHNKEGEKLGWAQFSETQRHNIASENYNLSYLQEVSRHNRASESVDWYNAQTRYSEYLENVRHNKADEALGYAKNPWTYLANPEAAQGLVDAWTSTLPTLGKSINDAGNSFLNSIGINTKTPEEHHGVGRYSNNNPQAADNAWYNSIGKWLEQALVHLMD